MFHRMMAVGSLGFLLVACAQMPSGTATPQPVTFTVTARAEAFSDRQPVTVQVYDAEQLAIMERTSGCTASYDAATGKEQINCPPGVTYQKPTPEETQVPRAQLTQGVVFASKTVTTGERYRLTLGGKAADDCNSAGGFAEGVATSAAIELKDLDIAQTLMACPPSE